MLSWVKIHFRSNEMAYFFAGSFVDKVPRTRFQIPQMNFVKDGDLLKAYLDINGIKFTCETNAIQLEGVPGR